jgi:hypothetical protein
LFSKQANKRRLLVRLLNYAGPGKQTPPFVTNPWGRLANGVRFLLRARQTIHCVQEFSAWPVR